MSSSSSSSYRGGKGKYYRRNSGSSSGGGSHDQEGGNNTTNNSVEGSSSQPASLSGPPRVSALGNPLPPLKKADGPPTVFPKKAIVSSSKEGPPSVATIGTPKAETSRTEAPVASTKTAGPPTVIKTASTPTGNGTVDPSFHQGSPAHNNTNKKKSKPPAQVVGPPPPLAVPQEGFSLPPPRTQAPRQQGPPQYRQQQPFTSPKGTHQPKQGPPQAAPDIKPMDELPEKLNSSSWGDDDQEDVSPDVIANRLRSQVERARAEKNTVQKQLSATQNDLERAQGEVAKLKEETESLRNQIEKTTTIEKSYASLRQTREALENERDALKKSLLKVEKELKTAKDDQQAAQKKVTKLEIEVEAMTAQVEYQKLEIEESKADLAKALSDSSTPRPALSVPVSTIQSRSEWLKACLAGSNVHRLAESLAFSHLESCVVNVTLWNEPGDVGMKKTLSLIAFERGGESLNPNSPSFFPEAKVCFSRILSNIDLFLFVPRRPEPIPPNRFQELLSQFLQVMSESREQAGAAKHFVVVLEDFPFNHMFMDNGRKLLPVHFCVV